MVYGYVRVSTDKQSIENQKFEISNFCMKSGLKVNKWVEETASGLKSARKRKLGPLLNRMNKGDVLICTEISRLGRNLLMIMSILHQCMQKDIHVWTIKDNYRLGSDISSKVLAFAFGISAEIERNLISQRTKEALARKRAEGVTLGRPKGRTGSSKLKGKENKIRNLLAKNYSLNHIAKILGVHRTTLSAFIKRRIPDSDDFMSLNL